MVPNFLKKLTHIFLEEHDQASKDNILSILKRKFELKKELDGFN